MFKQGLLEEARMIAGTKMGLTASQAIGYRELFEYFKGAITLDEARELIKKNTRRYAKRQLTWFGADSRIRWLLIKKGDRPRETAMILARMLKEKK